MQGAFSTEVDGQGGKRAMGTNQRRVIAINRAINGPARASPCLRDRGAAHGRLLERNARERLLARLCARPAKFGVAHKLKACELVDREALGAPPDERYLPNRCEDYMFPCHPAALPSHCPTCGIQRNAFGVLSSAILKPLKMIMRTSSCHIRAAAPDQGQGSGQQVGDSAHASWGMGCEGVASSEQVSLVSRRRRLVRAKG
jgi:hypothetical protein